MAKTTSGGKHLAVVGPWPPYRGGIAHFTAEMARALEQRGHRISGVSFSRQYPERLFPGKSQVEPEVETSRAADIPRLLDSVDPRSWWRTAAHLRELRPDAVIFQYWMPFFAPAFGTVARRLLFPDGRRPSRFAVVHNALPHERRPGDVVLSRYFFRTCDGLLALSSSVRHDLERIAPSVPVVERPHPVYEHLGPVVGRDEARRRLDLPRDAPVLLFFGFVRHYKGLDILLDALPRIVARQPRLRLVVAGEFYDDEETYRERARRLGVVEHVRVENRYIPADEVPVFFGAADLVVQPYRSATQSGVAQLAFGFGVPVVTTDVGGLAEAVPHEKAGLVVPPEDADALAGAVARFLEDASLASRLRAGAGQQRQTTGWEALCEAIEAFFTGAPREP